MQKKDLRCSCKPGISPFIQTKENNYSCMLDVLISKVAVRKYRETIEMKRKQVSSSFKHMYGKSLNIPDGRLTATIYKLQRIVEAADMDFKDIPAHIRKYINKDCTFYRKDKGRVVPVEAYRIYRACLKIKAGKSPKEVEDSLFK